MLIHSDFIRAWNEHMGADTPLTEQSMRDYLREVDGLLMAAPEAIDKPLTEDERAAVQFYLRNPSAAQLDFELRLARRQNTLNKRPFAVSELMKELDWCVENDHFSARTRAVLVSSAMLLTGVKVITQESKEHLHVLAANFRGATTAEQMESAYTELETFVAKQVAAAGADDTQKYGPLGSSPTGPMAAEYLSN